MSDYKMIYTILKEIHCSMLWYIISENTFTLEFCKIQFLNHLFYFYFLKVDISDIASYPLPRYSPPVNKIGMERMLSQISHLGPSFYFITKIGNLCHFLQRKRN